MKAKLDVGQAVYMRNENILMLAYRDKKSQKNPVMLLSTKGTVKSVEKVKKRHNGEETKIKHDWPIQPLHGRCR